MRQGMKRFTHEMKALAFTRTALLDTCIWYSYRCDQEKDFITYLFKCVHYWNKIANKLTYLTMHFPLINMVITDFLTPYVPKSWVHSPSFPIISSKARSLSMICLVDPGRVTVRSVFCESQAPWMWIEKWSGVTSESTRRRRQSWGAGASRECRRTSEWTDIVAFVAPAVGYRNWAKKTSTFLSPSYYSPQFVII